MFLRIVTSAHLDCKLEGADIFLAPANDRMTDLSALTFIVVGQSPGAVGLPLVELQSSLRGGPGWLQSICNLFAASTT
jgi:hypothetical protein